MRSPLVAAAAGAVAADLTFASVFMIWGVAQGVSVRGVLEVGPQILWIASILSLPGSLLCGWAIARWLRPGRFSRGAALVQGALWGWFLGTIHLVLLLLLNSEGYLERALRDPSSESFSVFCSGMTGALAQGLVCAWWVSRPEPKDVP